MARIPGGFACSKCAASDGNADKAETDTTDLDDHRACRRGKGGHMGGAGKCAAGCAHINILEYAGGGQLHHILTRWQLQSVDVERWCQHRAPDRCDDVHDLVS